MIKRNIKMVVTSEESKQVQEICFANGIFWGNGDRSTMYTYKPFLYISTGITFGDKMKSFKENSKEEVDAKFFIRTQGSCIEENQEQELKQNIEEEQMKDNEVETYKDVKEYLVAKGLYDRVMEIKWEDLITYTEFSNLFTWNETIEDYSYWSEVDTKLVKLNIEDNIESLVQDYKAIQGGETYGDNREKAEKYVISALNEVEETPKQELKQNTNKEETMEKNEVETYADVKEYLLAKGLYERVLEIDWETYEEDTFSDLFTWSETEEGWKFWGELNGEILELDIEEKIESLVQDYKAKQGKEFIKHLEAQPDEYADLRKALRVGKIIQLNGSAVNGGYGETWNDCKQEDLFVWGRDAYRVKPTEQKPKQYLCYVQGKALPKHIHKTLEQAKQEAQRLCRKELAKVSVLEVVAEFQAEVLVKEVL